MYSKISDDKLIQHFAGFRGCKDRRCRKSRQ